MRITDVNIPKEEITNGLEAVKMNRLGQVVLLAGKNGAGKSRLLQLINFKNSNKPNKNDIINAKKNIKIHKDNRERLLIQNAAFRNSIRKEIHSVNEKSIYNSIEQNMLNINKFDSAISSLKNRLNWSGFDIDKETNDIKIVFFIPKSLNLNDQNKFNKEDLRKYAANVNSIGVSNLPKGVFSMIQVIQDTWFESTHPNSTVSEIHKSNAISNYEKLAKIINIFLNTSIGRNKNGEPTLFGFALAKANLSDGQKILLQLCLAIHCQGAELNEMILFLDEPENHLHPDIIIQTVERLIKHIPNGQVWIATHSIPLLSYFGAENIWYMDNNEVHYAGNGPEKVLKSLLGDDEKIGKLQDFINEPGLMALHRHAFESLFMSAAVETTGADPQNLQIKDAIKKYLKDDNKIKILDYGAGKGRLLANIAEANAEPVESFKKWFDYVAFDKYKEDKDVCISKIEGIYTDAKDRYFNHNSTLLTKHDKGSFDIVIMCNVLHEIDPKDWIKLFKKDGEISKLLSNEGILLLVEDQEMPIGEKAYQKGFIVLDTAELKELFSIKTTDKDFGFNDAREDGRLKAHFIKKEFLMRISAKSRLSALKDIHNTASQKILDVREEDVNYKNGKKHGFWLQQYANTGLAIAELDS